LKGLILDLRFNGGGLLDVAVKIANLFIAEGTLATTDGKYEQSRREFPAKRISCLYPDLDLVVLINHETASAAEVLAGTLQDHGRAKLVGTRSLGKGVVQSCDRFEINGKGVFLKYPSALIFLPSGRCIDRELGNQDFPGLQPDYPVKLGRDAVIRLRKYLDTLRLTFHHGHQDPLQDAAIPPDPQLEAALGLLRKM
jgi:carboxyl-terminal processing protease